MRYLHPVAVTEKFIAKGVYHFYQRDVLLLDYREAWTRHALGGGGILTRIDQERKGRTTLMEVLASESGQIERLTVREWNKDPQIAYRTLRADYIFFQDYAQISRRLDDQETENREIAFQAPIDAVALWMVSTVYHEQAPLLSRFIVEKKLMKTFEPRWRDISLGTIKQEIPTMGYPDSDEDHPLRKAYNFADCIIVLNEQGFMAYAKDATEGNKTVTVLTEYAHI